MQLIQEPIVKDLVLIGGGHSHAIVLRMFGMKPLPGVRLTLITDVSHTPYSGMLPGHVAGFYDLDESHIDLRSLTQFAQAQLYIDRAIALDLTHNRVLCANRPPVAFDLLSIDIGSTPTITSVPGAAEYAIPAKPVPQFLANWNPLIEQVVFCRDKGYGFSSEKPLRLAIVGGGAGGVELALSMQGRLLHLLKEIQQPPENIEIHLFHRGAEILPTHNKWVRDRVQEMMRDRGIHLHQGETAIALEKTRGDKHPTPYTLHCESGLVVKCDRVFWVTQASAPSWLGDAGLATDKAGFIQVGATLQSISHPHIFAAGDIATTIDRPWPKAGVFAVRQGKPLFENLRRSLLGKPLKTYKPQKQFLTLIGTGTGEAIASRGFFGCGPSPLLWRWKDWIDRRFMEKFSNLPQMSAIASQSSVGSLRTPPYKAADKIYNPMRCAGCGSKVGSATLEKVLSRLRSEQPSISEREDILIGLDAPDDAAVVRIPEGQLMVHTIDYFRSLINDPFLFGQISANHCLSDIFAMGAAPQSALAIATIPYAAPAKVEETLYQLLAGATKVLHEAETPLVGGHTTEGSELAFGLSCNGLVHPHQLLRKGGILPGQMLIMTKALGTGTLFAADMRRQAKGRWIDGAIASMLLSDRVAAQCLVQHGASACTDVTGFGLLGHLLEMIQASHVAADLYLDAIAVLEGARETVQLGIVSSLQLENMRSLHSIQNLSEVTYHPNYPLLFDPQTAGGLLAAIPAEQAESCVRALRALGYLYSRTIGRALPAEEGILPVRAIV